MKNLKNLLLSAVITMSAALGCAPLAHAQGNFDYFAVPRTIILAAPAIRTTTTSSNTVWLDTHGSLGICKVDINCVTNVADSGAAPTAVAESSPDQTNWTAVSYGQATQYALLFTNSTYSANGLLATNNTMIPGTITTPVSATAGFANQYIAPVPYTNTAAITLGTGVYSIGFNAADIGRYLRVRFVIPATATNICGAVLTAKRAQGN